MIHDDMVGGGNHQRNIAGQFIAPTDYGEMQHPLPFVENSLYDMSPNDCMSPDLQQINSSDLVAFQTVEHTPLLPEECYPGCPNLSTENNAVMNSDSFPKLTEHNDGDLDFELNLTGNTSASGQNNWYYSSLLKKVFIKLDKPFYIDAIYSSKAENEYLLLRAMMVFIEDVGSPVHRCHNHTSNDEDEENVKFNVLRSENSRAIYMGTKMGKNVNDRLSVVIPLGLEKPNENDQIKHSIALKFLCQNSCIGRKPTAVVFSLENKSGQVLGKRFFNVRICSCPKRDKNNEEERFNKRGAKEIECPPGKKIKILTIKEEPDIAMPESPMCSPSAQSSIEEHPNGFRLHLDLPNREAVNNVIAFAFKEIAGQMASDPSNSDSLSKCLKNLKKLKERENRKQH